MGHLAKVESAARQWGGSPTRRSRAGRTHRHARLTQASLGGSVVQSASPSISNLRHFRPFPPAWSRVRSAEVRPFPLEGRVSNRASGDPFLRHLRNLRLARRPSGGIRPWPPVRPSTLSPLPPPFSASFRRLSDPLPIRFRPTAPSTCPTAQNRLACFPKIACFRFSESFGKIRTASPPPSPFACLCGSGRFRSDSRIPKLESRP